MFFRQFRYAGALLALIMFAVSVIPHETFAQDVAARRAQLQSQLDALEKQISQTQGTLNTLHTQGQSIQRDINILDADIKKAQLQIQATQVQIQALAENIDIHSSTIEQLTGKLASGREGLAEIIRHTREMDDYSLIEVVMSAEDVSDFFGDLDTFATLKEQIAVSSKELTRTRSATETEKDALLSQKSEREKLRAIQVAEQQKVKDLQRQKQVLLAQNKKEAATYQSIYDTQQKTAAQIRAELFALAGGSGSISLPNAIALAKQAGAATGVRPALVLAVLKQETDIGKNLGSGTWQEDMHPTRDVPVFKVIMQTLGLNPDTVKVSAAPSYGYGGAMGPSQFIPSTWACYGGFVNTTTNSCGKGTDGTYAGPWKYVAAKDRVAKLAGHPSTPSNPYNNLDAFTATAMLMADNGATAKTRAAERLAALRYFAGYGNANNPAYAFYGDGVMKFADQFQADIDTLGG